MHAGGTWHVLESVLGWACARACAHLPELGEGPSGGESASAPQIHELARLSAT